MEGETPLLIIEGPERVGKSTLAKEMLASWDAGPKIYAHQGKFPSFKQLVLDYREAGERLNEDPATLIVMDRSYLSTLVYDEGFYPPTLGLHWEMGLGQNSRAVGERIVLVPQNAEAEIARQDRLQSDDIRLMGETAKFEMMGKQWRWSVLGNMGTFTKELMLANLRPYIEATDGWLGPRPWAMKPPTLIMRLPDWAMMATVAVAAGFTGHHLTSAAYVWDGAFPAAQKAIVKSGITLLDMTDKTPETLYAEITKAIYGQRK